ncbi:hypothetical protein Trydic_g2149 [Trypoxylus dichotomus]
MFCICLTLNVCYRILYSCVINEFVYFPFGIRNPSHGTSSSLGTANHLAREELDSRRKREVGKPDLVQSKESPRLRVPFLRLNDKRCDDGSERAFRIEVVLLACAKMVFQSDKLQIALTGANTPSCAVVTYETREDNQMKVVLA